MLELAEHTWFDFFLGIRKILRVKLVMIIHEAQVAEKENYLEKIINLWVII